jgi:probable FeS assembly SUF system protein SufT
MSTFETVELKRDCEVTLIPSGEKRIFNKGARVHITQSLGGSFTLMTEQGFMVRLEGKDAEAIGKPAPEAPQGQDEQGNAVPLEKQVWDQLRTCYDPEIPVNIVDLGLVYECEVKPMTEDINKKSIHIKMTLTAPGCGMGESIRMDAKSKIERLSGVGQVNVDLVWEPAWERSMMSEAAKLKLGIMDES